MKLLVTLLSLVVAQLILAAEPKTISSSPDSKYAIVVDQDEQLGLVYRLQQVQPEQMLLQIKSSYQPNSPTDNSARNDTEAAQVKWSIDSKSVAIDEYNLRFKGEVFAARIIAGDKAERLIIPVSEVVKTSGERWVRYRLFCDTGWLPDGNLGLSIIGNAFVDKVSGTEQTEGEIGYDVTLKLVPSLVIISLRADGE